MEAAAAFIARQHAAELEPTPSPMFPTKANLFGVAGGSEDEDIQKLHRDPLKFQDDTLRTMLADLQISG